MPLMSATALLFTAVICAPDFTAAVTPAIHRTEVLVFRPSLPTSTRLEQRGRCWTESIAVNRADAWRCMQGNMVYDPCFQVADRRNVVVCGADPARQTNGFGLILTEPLPSRSSVTKTLQPWLIELSNGSVCEPATGTIAVVEGEPVRYPCSASRPQESQTPRIYCGLLDSFHRGRLWTAEKVCYTVVPSDGSPPFKLQKRETDTIRRVWE
jgi:hypothetical protein